MAGIGHKSLSIILRLINSARILLSVRDPDSATMFIRRKLLIPHGARLRLSIPTIAIFSSIAKIKNTSRMLGAFYFYNVDIVRNYWNRLERWVFEIYDLVSDGELGVM